ncbi:hypothetical protein ACWKWU_10220 [Chitinophaga lutea]
MRKLLLVALATAGLFACRKDAKTPAPEPVNHPDFSGAWKATESTRVNEMNKPWTVLTQQHSTTLRLQASDSTFEMSNWGSGTFRTIYRMSEANPAHYRLSLYKTSDTLNFLLLQESGNLSFILVEDFPHPIAPPMAFRYIKQ